MKWERKRVRVGSDRNRKSHASSHFDRVSLSFFRGSYSLACISFEQPGSLKNMGMSSLSTRMRGGCMGTCSRSVPAGSGPGRGLNEADFSCWFGLGESSTSSLTSPPACRTPSGVRGKGPQSARKVGRIKHRCSRRDTSSSLFPTFIFGPPSAIVLRILTTPCSPSHSSQRP